MHLGAFKAVLDGDPPVVLYHGRPAREVDPGRRPRLHPAHRLLMYLESKSRTGRKRHWPPGAGSRRPLCPSASSIPRTPFEDSPPPATSAPVWRRQGRPTSCRRPCARPWRACVRRLAQASTEVSVSISKTLPHNHLIRDGFHTPHNRPSDKNCRNYVWSIKMMYSFTVLETNEQGIAVGMSERWPGSWYDMSIPRIDEDKARHPGRAPPREERGDHDLRIQYRGFQGLQRPHSGAVACTPAKKAMGTDFARTRREDAKRICRARI